MPEDPCCCRCGAVPAAWKACSPPPTPTHFSTPRDGAAPRAPCCPPLVPTGRHPDGVPTHVILTPNPVTQPRHPNPVFRPEMSMLFDLDPMPRANLSRRLSTCSHFSDDSFIADRDAEFEFAAESGTFDELPRSHTPERMAIFADEHEEGEGAGSSCLFDGTQSLSLLVAPVREASAVCYMPYWHVINGLSASPDLHTNGLSASPDLRIIHNLSFSGRTESMPCRVVPTKRAPSMLLPDADFDAPRASRGPLLPSLRRCRCHPLLLHPTPITYLCAPRKRRARKNGATRCKVEPVHSPPAYLHRPLHHPAVPDPQPV